MNLSQRLGLLKVVCCCLLFFGISFIQVSPAAYAADGTIVEVIDSQGAVTASLEGILLLITQPSRTSIS